MNNTFNFHWLSIFLSKTGLTACCFLILLSSCSDESKKPSLNHTNDFFFTQIFDIDNNHNASDIYFSVNIKQNVSIEILYLVVVKQVAVDGMNLAQFTELNPSSYTAFSVDGSTVRGKLKSNQTDLDGENLELNDEYQLIAFNPANNSISKFSRILSLKDIAPLIGEYVGTWNDNFYTNFGISSRITAIGENSYSGEFFYSGSFLSCCGGSNDGHIFFGLDNGDLSNFVYNQDLITYKDGCPGYYEGSGVLDGITLNINFEGDDCDGHHTNGIIKLVRIK